MYSRLQLAIFLLLSLLGLLGVALAVPARSRRDEGVQIHSGVHDAGPLDVCEEVTVPFCDNIRYRVPASVAKIANILEEQIQDSYQSLLGIGDVATNCAEAVRQIRCKQSFPECSSESGTVVLSTPDNCEARISENCGTLTSHLLGDGTCSLSNGTFSLSECNPTTSYNYEFQHCPVGASVEVTHWMFEIMKHADSRLEYQFSQPGGFGDMQYDSCRENYARFSCQMQGQCQAGGQRAEIVNDYQLCDNIANCYSQFSLAGDVRSSFACDLWPPPFLTTMEPVTTPQTSSSAATTFTAEPTWPTPSGTNGMPPVAGGASQVNSLSLCVTMLIAFTATLQWFYR